MQAMRLHSLVESCSRTYVHTIACPLSARFRSALTMDRAPCESRPEVGSSRKSRGGYRIEINVVLHLIIRLTSAISSMAMLTRRNCSMPNVPMMASEYGSRPHIVIHSTTLRFAISKSPLNCTGIQHTGPSSLKVAQIETDVVVLRTRELRARSTKGSACPPVGRTR